MSRWTRKDYLRAKSEMKSILRGMGHATDDHEENIYKLRLLTCCSPKELPTNDRKFVVQAVAIVKRIKIDPAINFAPRSEIRAFYRSEPWIALRQEVLQRYGRKCMNCGDVAPIVHVDHIKPLRKYWNLRLRFDNLQVLCSRCNRCKGNWDETDYRTYVYSDKDNGKGTRMRYQLTIDYECSESPGTWDYKADNARDVLEAAMKPLTDTETVRVLGFRLEQLNKPLPKECLEGEIIPLEVIDPGIFQ